jgi:eukaryotic-like serine/threonine-protein kinase
MIGNDLTGAVIADRFEIRGRLGDGGMGMVYRAWQRSVQREVAIKVIAPNVGGMTEAIQRFEREAQIASQLSHPGFVTVLDHGQSPDGRLFIAMELVRGRALHRVLKQEGALAVERVVRIGVQICDALETAHAYGVVHRDLKLENVMVLDHPPGRDLIKVLDFGLAKLTDDSHHLTARGLVVGTPHYISPEASVSGHTTPACDIYALGVILGELATGAWLWTGDSLTKLLAAKRQPSVVIQRLPPQLQRAIGAMLHPDPKRRATAAQARALLADGVRTDAVDEVLHSLRSEADPEKTTVVRKSTQPGARATPRQNMRPPSTIEDEPALPPTVFTTEAPTLDRPLPFGSSRNWMWRVGLMLIAAVASALVIVLAAPG